MKLGDRAAARGLKVGYEALAWGLHVNDHREAWSLVRDTDHPAIGLILDTFHSLSRNIPSSSIGDIRPEKLFLVQVADAPRLDMDLLQWSRHFRCMPGQGDLAVTDWAEAIWRTGYDGWWSLEIFNDRFRAGSASSVAQDGNRSLLALHDAVARRPRSPLTPQIPPPVHSERMAFIEFAASHEEAAALGTDARGAWFSCHRTPPPQGRDPAGVRATSTSSSIPNPKALRTVSTSCMALPCALSGWKWMMFPRRWNAPAPWACRCSNKRSGGTRWNCPACEPWAAACCTSSQRVPKMPFGRMSFLCQSPPIAMASRSA